MLPTVLSLLAGCVVLASGAVLVLSRRARWWRLVALPLIAIGLFWTAVPAVVAWMATHPAGAPPTGRTPTDEDLAYEGVTLVTEDGVELRAWYLPSSNGGAVIAVHGAGRSTRASLLPHAKVLVGAGYGVLLLDTRGHGDSSGTAMDFGWYGERDIACAVDYLDTRPDVAPGGISVLGLSMGGEQALTAAATDTRISAVIAEGATNRVYEDVRTTLEGPSVFLGVPQYRALYGLTDAMTPASPPAPLTDVMALVAPRPVLLICTSGEARYGRIYAGIAPDSTKLWAPASEVHTGALAERPDEWERRVLEVLDGVRGVTGAGLD